MKTACPNCRKRFNAPDGYEGRVARCPACAATFTITPIDSTGPAAPPVTHNPQTPVAGDQSPQLRQPSTPQPHPVESDQPRDPEPRAEASTPQTPPPTPVPTAGSHMKHCPFCAGLVVAQARKCVHCGEWLDEKMRQNTARIGGETRFSDAQPLWQLILMSLATFGIYQIAWFYRNWKAIKTRTQAEYSPGLRTLGLFAPFYNLYLIFAFFISDIHSLDDSVDSADRLRTGPLLALVFVILGLLIFLPGWLCLLSLLSIVPLAIAQAHLNRCWSLAQPALAPRPALPGGHIACYITGSITWLTVLAVSLAWIGQVQYYYMTPAEQLAHMMRSHVRKIFIQRAPAERFEQLKAEMSTVAAEPDEQLSDAAEIASHWQDSIVLIVTRDDKGNELAQGSGFIITPSGAVATNYHVLEDASDAHIIINEQEYDRISLIQAFPNDDIAILSIDSNKQFTPIWLGDSDAVKPGEGVIAITNPAGLQRTVSDGLISAIHDIDGIGMLQISAPISPGSSGGPIMNTRGQVIGIATFASIKYLQNINFALPINLLKSRIKGQ